MLHPSVVRKYSKINGRGLFAKKRIPEGTVIWRMDGDVRIYTGKEIDDFRPSYKKLLVKYGYYDQIGRLVFCTDNAKYWNHSCDPNSAPIAMDADIAIRDIDGGEELTYDYALLESPGYAMTCSCGTSSCRHTVIRLPITSDVIAKLFRASISAAHLGAAKAQPLLRNEKRKLERIASVDLYHPL